MNSQLKAAMIPVLLLAVLFTQGCQSQQDTTTPDEGGNKLTAIEVMGMPEYPAEATVGTKEITADTYITLADSNIAIEGEGAIAQDSTLTITKPGTYAIDGTLTQGQIIVEDTTETDKVKIILNGVNIQSPTAGAIYIKNADKAVIEAADGSVNILSAGETPSDEEANAVIYSKDDMKIKGSGDIYITAPDKGIHGKDDVEIEEANLYITAVDDGIRGKDSVTVTSGNIIIETQEDGIHSDNEADTDRGWIAINGGHIEIVANQDGIQAVNDLAIAGGETYIVTNGGAGEPAGSTPKDPGMGSGFTREQELNLEREEATDEHSAEESASYKGIKTNSTITITGGVVVADCSDDTIHANGAITITGGSLDLTSGDDGIHADTDLTISGGVIAVTQSYEGLEAANINLQGGEINITSSDDGINAADGTGTAGSFTAQGGSCTLNITGGDMTVNSQGDGIDVNGSVIMEDGSVLVYGPSNGGNGGLDYDGTFEVNGGNIIIFSSREMAMGIAETSAQPNLFVGLTGKADSTLKITDENGNVIAEETCPKEYGCVIVSTPDLTKGLSYNFYLDEENLGAFEAQ